MRALLRFQAPTALLVYLVASVAIFGRHVVVAPDSRVVGDLGADKTIFMWNFVWWPHALVHLHDPFHTTAVWAPHGIDLAWITATPGASLFALPLTFTAGPVVAYNVLMLAAPAAAAWCAYLLCRKLTGRFWASLAGGWVFGFSAFEVNQTDGHLHMTLTFLVPLAALLIVTRARGELRRPVFLAALALTLTFQFLFSTEMFFTLVLVAAIVGALGWWRLPELRSTLRPATLDAGYALALAGLLLTPYWIHAFFVAGPPTHAIQSPSEFGADVLNFVSPTRRIWLQPGFTASLQHHFRGNGVEQTAYLGLPLVALGLVFMWQARKRRADSVLALALAVLVVLACGPYIRAAGRVVGLGPWWLFAELPVTESALPVRLTMYIALGIGVVLALFLAREASRRRWAFALLALVFILPNPSESLWTSTVPRTTFFSQNRFERFIHPADSVLVFPYGPVGWSMLWQAETHLRFHMIGGYLGPRKTPEEGHWYELYHGFAGGPLPRDAPRRLRRFLAVHDVRWIVVAPGAKPKVRRLVSTLRLPAIRSGDTLLYRVKPA